MPAEAPAMVADPEPRRPEAPVRTRRQSATTGAREQRFVSRPGRLGMFLAIVFRKLPKHARPDSRRVCTIQPLSVDAFGQPKLVHFPKPVAGPVPTERNRGHQVLFRPRNRRQLGHGRKSV